MSHPFLKGVILSVFFNTWSVSLLVVDSSKVSLHSGVTADPDENRNVVSIKIWSENRDVGLVHALTEMFSPLPGTVALYSYHLITVIFISVLIQPTANCPLSNSKVSIKYHAFSLNVYCEKNPLFLCFFYF